MHPLSLRLVLLRNLHPILKMKASGVLQDKVWIMHEEISAGEFTPIASYPPCWDFEIAKAVERELTMLTGNRVHAVPFAIQSGGLL